MTEIQFASEELVAIAAQCLTGLLEAFADEAAARKSRIDKAGSRSGQSLTKNTTKNVESEPVGHKQFEGAAESSSREKGEDKLLMMFLKKTRKALHKQVPLLDNVPQHRGPLNKLPQVPLPISVPQHRKKLRRHSQVMQCKRVLARKEQRRPPLRVHLVQKLVLRLPTMIG